MTPLLLSALLGLATPFSTVPSQPPSPAFATAASQATGDIRDIRGPIPVAHPPYLWIAAAAAGLCLGGAYLWYRRRHRHPRLRSPEELAKERLEQARRIMVPASVREFSFEVAEAIRVYIEQRFNLRAECRTSEEFLNDLLVQPSSPLAPWRPTLGEFLNQCDLAKFARGQMSRPQMESLLVGAEIFVDKTTGVAA